MALFSWRLRCPQDLVTKVWGHDMVVWHTRSGDVHMLGGVAAEVFAQLQIADADTQTLQSISGAWSSRTAPDSRDLDATLQDMMRLGLVTAHPT